MNQFYFNVRILAALILGISMNLGLRAQGPTSWTKKADVAFSTPDGPAERFGSVGFSIGNKGYVGIGSNGGQLKDFWEYNPVDSSWTQKADYPGAAWLVTVGFTIGNKGYVGIGSTGPNISTDFWEFDPVGNTWTRKANFPGAARQGAVGFSIGNKGYVGTGNDNQNNQFNDFWEYNPSTDSWTQKANFGGSARSEAVGFSIGNKGYIGSGTSATDFWEYNPSTDSWAKKADFPGGTRSSPTGFALNGKGYIGMGANKKDFWEYDPINDNWTQKANFVGTSRYGVVSFVIGTKGYIGMGFEIVQGGNYTNEIWGFDPVANLWKKEPNFGGAPRANGVGYSIGSKGYIGMGLSTGNNLKKDLWEYDVPSNKWIQKKSLSAVARQDAVGFSIGDKSYFGLGEFENNWWEYDPSTDSWSQKATITGGIRTKAVGFSIGNKGYVGTGYNNFEFKKDFYEYNPVTNNWTQKADFGGIARGYATGFSIGNKGYIGLGIGGNSYQKDFWEYNPLTDTWSRKADFGGTARIHVASFSIGSKGYVGTGVDAIGNQKDFWEYDPAIDSWFQKTNFGGVARYGAVGFSIGGKGYVGTGNDGNNFLRDFWEYDPTCYLTAAINPSTSLSVCAGAPLSFSGSSTGGVTPTYSWSGGGGLFTSNQQNPTFSFPVVDKTTDYTLSLTVSESGCRATASVTVTVYAVSVGGTVSSDQIVCPNIPVANLTLSGQVGNVVKWQKSTNSAFSSPIDIASTSTILTNAFIGNLTSDTYFRALVKNTACSEVYSTSVLLRVLRKPTIALSTLQQSLSEGNAQVFCDIDTNPVNSLQFDVSSSCVIGSLVWRVQVGNGAWGAWSATPPATQPSNNQPHRYQAACDASCPTNYTSPIEVTINYRASVPQNVSLVADGVTVKEGETKEICNLEGNAITFNATCAAGESVTYSVDGGEYGSVVPTQLVDGQYHNYRVRCRKSDGTLSCIETESGVMRIRLSSVGQAPVASLNVTSGCGTPVPFSGAASCGTLTTVWYNASTNVALPTLPSQTPTETTSYYTRCQAEGGCISEKSNVVTFTVTPISTVPVVVASAEVVCAGQEVTLSTTCPAGASALWNTGEKESSIKASFGNMTKQGYSVRCVYSNGCQSVESAKKEIVWKAFELTFINIGESKSSVKVNDRAAWTSQFITHDGGPVLEQSTQVNPTLYFVENVNKVAPRYWTINVDACALGTNGSLTFDLLATPETGVPQSFNTHENNAPYFMYANREGWTELYAQNHPAYGFYQDNGAGANAYDTGLPKGLYKLGIRYWDQKGWGSIYPSTRKAQGNVLAYQEYWFRIQSKNGVGVGAARTADSGQQSVISEEQKQMAIAPLEGRGLLILPNPVTNLLRLQVPDSKGQLVKTELMDVSGRSVLSRSFVPETNTHQEEFKMSELPTGMYFLKVSTSEKQTTLKVVKM